MLNKKQKYLLTIFVITLLILFVEPTVATENGGEIDDVNWWAVIKDGLNIFANILEYAADIVRQGAEKLVELFDGNEQ